MDSLHDERDGKSLGFPLRLIVQGGPKGRAFETANFARDFCRLLFD